MRKNHDFSLTPTWPACLPERCHCCNHPYDIRSSLEIGPGPAGRFFRRIAPWMTIVMLGIMFATKLSFLTLGGWGGAMAFAVALVVPSVILWVIGGLLPTRARLYCFKCNTTTFHRVPRKIDNRIPVVTE
jgi:hypothetical protein